MIPQIRITRETIPWIMKSLRFLFSVPLLCVATSMGEVTLSEDVFGSSLGGWKRKDTQMAEYPLSGSLYRTYRPEISKTPEGGIFLSIRIDHVRGWLSSDDHAMLEITVNPQGVIRSAKSNIAIQGRSITSDVILGTTEMGQELSGANRAIQVGTDLVSDLTAKLLRENLVEAGRVSFPAAIRHNYNLLYQALRVNDAPVQPLQVSLPSSSAAVLPAPQDHVTQNPLADPHAAAPEGSAPVGLTPMQPPVLKDEAPPVAKPVPENAGVSIEPFGAPPEEANVAE